MHGELRVGVIKVISDAINLKGDIGEMIRHDSSIIAPEKFIF